MPTTSSLPELVQKKLTAFDALEAEFIALFQFLEAVHGQRRFSTFSIADTVRYLHALWVAECKTCLLSVSKTVKEYEGRRSLELLRQWQQERDTEGVVAFLQHRLDMLPLTDITRQVHQAWTVEGNDKLAQRLLHGRLVMLNRGFNLLYALDALFALPEEDLFAALHNACEQYGHLPDQIEQQLAQMETPLYSFAPHQVLAQRNMLVMNSLGISTLQTPADLPQNRTERVEKPTEPIPPFAEHVIEGYRELTAPAHNNLNAQRFIDRPEASDSGTV